MSGYEAARLAQARAWLRQDPDPETRDELAGLITRAGSGDDAAVAELEDRFGSRLAFGTAGLRGEIAAGSNRMNRVLVAQAAAGFAAYLNERAAPGTTPTVVIGYDGRKNSRVFASDSAEIFAGAGLRAILLPRLLPTPVLAFAVRHLGADAGVMVTASHNPPNDNGYKVYLGGADQGSQIVAPADAEIAAHIERIAEEGDALGIPRSTAYETAGEAIVDAYVAATAAVAPAPVGTAGLRWVYTALHGVGWETFSRILGEAGYPAPWTVSEQRDPDPTFRTVSFPNPEEPGAMDLAFAKARTLGAELVIANDPDADRLAVGIPDASADGRLAPAHRQRGRPAARLARRPRGHGGRAGGSRHLPGLLAGLLPRARRDRRAVRAGLPRDAHRLQVDLPRPRHRLRLRGGAGLPGEPGDRARQGRHLRGDRPAGPGRRGPRDARRRSRICSTNSPPRSAATRADRSRSASRTSR